MNPKRLKRKINKKVLKKYGLDLTLLRLNESAEVDRYGEPITSPWPFDELTIRVFIEHERDFLEQMALGGLTDDKKEYLQFWVSGDADIRLGDKIIYPSGSEEQWLINRIEPYAMNDIVWVNEVRAIKDDRYG